MPKILDGDTTLVVDAHLIGWIPQADYNIDGKIVSSRKIDIRYPGGIGSAKMSVPEALHVQIGAQLLARGLGDGFGTPVTVTLEPRVDRKTDSLMYQPRDIVCHYDLLALA